MRLAHFLPAKMVLQRAGRRELTSQDPHRAGQLISIRVQVHNFLEYDQDQMPLTNQSRS